MSIDVKLTRNPFDMSSSVTANFDELAIHNIGWAVFEKVAQAIAERYVAEHYAEIVAKIDPQAIANLAVASAGTEINKTLKEKIPDKVLEVVRTETQVYQRGVLGGMTRIR